MLIKNSVLLRPDNVEHISITAAQCVRNDNLTYHIECVVTDIILGHIIYILHIYTFLIAFLVFLSGHVKYQLLCCIIMKR